MGAEVLQAARIVLDRLGLDAEYLAGRHRLGILVQGRRPASRPHHRTVERSGCGPVRSHHLQAGAGGRARSWPRGLRDKGLVYRSPIVRMRQLFDLYVCLRPCRAFAGNPLNTREGIDLVIFRENTEDLYAGVEFHPVPQSLSRLLEEISPSFAPFKGLAPDQWAISCKINSRKGSERIVRAAFQFARDHRRKKVTVVHKANVVRATDGLFLEAARRIAASFPGIAWDHANVDAMAMWLLKNPLNYDVLVAPNLFGDIISDLCAQMVGGLGFACSGNIGDRLAVFEPTHGSAPKYVGQSKVNPIATILAAKMMLDYLSEGRKSQRLEEAVGEVIREGRVRTYDMGGASTTLQMAEAIAGKL